MQSTFTKDCTQCYFSPPEEAHLPEFTKRQVLRPTHFQQRVFTSQDRFGQDQVYSALKEIQDLEIAKKSAAMTRDSTFSRQQRPPWKDIVNEKRRIIERIIQSKTCDSISEIARITKASRNTVKTVMRDLQFQGHSTEFEYNNVKSREDVDELQRSVDQIEQGFMTVTMIKRKHPGFSRKKILKVLHDSGYRYRLLPKERKHPDKRTPNSTRIRRIISHIAQAITDPNTTLLYIDEMKFPLVQTAERRWAHVDTDPKTALVYNRRPVADISLTAIAMCSLEKFEAVQIFQNEVTGPDFLYFLNQAIAQLPPNRHYTIITDNATWHHAKVVTSAKVSDFLYFNEPKMFQLNVIENAFSYVRHAFRVRPIVETLEQEAKNIVDIFFDDGNRDRFKGFFRQHLRNLLEFLEKHRQK